MAAQTTAALDSVRQWRAQAAGTMRFLLTLLATLFAALALGFGSAWYMIERGSPLTTVQSGPWTSWLREGDPNADAYTRAHLARTGRLPLAPTSGVYFIARNDSEGQPLTSACEYEISGSPLNARWWSIALYDSEGRVLPNPSDRFSFNSSETIRHADGTYRIHLARNARPENWLPIGPGPDRNLLLMLRIYGPRTTDERGAAFALQDKLPVITRKTCD